MKIDFITRLEEEVKAYDEMLKTLCSFDDGNNGNKTYKMMCDAYQSISALRNQTLKNLETLKLEQTQKTTEKSINLAMLMEDRPAKIKFYKTVEINEIVTTTFSVVDNCNNIENGNSKIVRDIKRVLINFGVAKDDIFISNGIIVVTHDCKIICK